MKITLVSSCGLVLEQDGQTLLIDALNKQYRCYYGLPPETFVRMLSGEPPYDAVCFHLQSYCEYLGHARSNSVRLVVRR